MFIRLDDGRFINLGAVTEATTNEGGDLNLHFGPQRGILLIGRDARVALALLREQARRNEALACENCPVLRDDKEQALVESKG